MRVSDYELDACLELACEQAEWDELMAGVPVDPWPWPERVSGPEEGPPDF